MRLIDADALKELMIDVLTQIKSNPKMDGQEMHIISAMTMLGEMIDDSPTIEERKTGRWIDIDSETYTWKIRCDKCGHERSMLSTQGNYPKFCEGCGAKMEEREEE